LPSYFYNQPMGNLLRKARYQFSPRHPHHGLVVDGVYDLLPINFDMDVHLL
jgi:hypothetical protein